MHGLLKSDNHLRSEEPDFSDLPLDSESLVFFSLSAPAPASDDSEPPAPEKCLYNTDYDYCY